MKNILLIGFVLLLSYQVKPQIDHYLTVDPAQSGNIFPSFLKPGIFYHQFWIPQQNNILEYVSHPAMYNTFRDNKFGSECWKWSSSRQDVLNRMDEHNLKNWLEWQQQYAERVVVKIGSMPYWLSSSDDWSVMGDESWRVFMTHPPQNYNDWNTAIIAVVNKIASWGIHPYYEIWNEPDGMYWQGTDDDLLKVYKQTALSIKNADPLAKVGGFGMHTWWRSVDPQLANEQNAYKSPVMGFLPDSIPGKYSIIYKLLDSIANSWATEEVPLDFISYHFFNWNSYDLVHTSEQLRNKMEELGYSPPGTKTELTFPELYISEWQTTYHIEEQLFQPGLFLRIMRQFESAEIEMNSIAAINDFGSSENNEFNNDWGMFSQNALIKPVFKGLLYLSEVTQTGRSLETEHDYELDVFASLKEDTLRMLVSNYSMPVWWYHNYYRFAWSCYERLLYDSTSVFNAMDFISYGMTSIYWGNSNNDYGTVDSIIMGKIEPPDDLPAEMINSLILAREQYVYDSTATKNKHNVNFDLKVDNDSLMVYYYIIDSNQNNIIFLYDSLRNNLGYSHQRTIDSLQSCTFPGGCFGIYSEADTLIVTDNEFTLSINPNSVLLMVIPGIQYQTVDLAENDLDQNQLIVFPNPVTPISKIKFEIDKPGLVVLEIYDNLGRLVFAKDMGYYENGQQLISFPKSSLIKSGIYHINLRTPAKILSSSILID